MPRRHATVAAVKPLGFQAGSAIAQMVGASLKQNAQLVQVSRFVLSTRSVAHPHTPLLRAMRAGYTYDYRVPHSHPLAPLHPCTPQTTPHARRRPDKEGPSSNLYNLKESVSLANLGFYNQKREALCRVFDDERSACFEVLRAIMELDNPDLIAASQV